MGRAFVMELRGGNRGLAIRTDGSKPRGAYKPKPIGKNLFLLYGPSVDQVFRTVSEDVAPDVADELEVEFNRLLDLKDIV